MKRLLLIAVLGLMATACGDSSNNNDPDPGGNVGATDNGLDPTTALLESPPTNGKLPADLMPPI